MELGDLIAPGAVDHVGVERIRGNVAVFDGPHRMPVAVGDLPIVAAAGDAHRATLLLRGAHAIGKSGRDTHVEELRGRLVEPRTPGLTAVHGDERALVADQRDDARIVRVDPQVLVVVAARSASQRQPGAAAVAGLHGDDAGAVDDIRIAGIDAHHGQIAAADAQRRAGVRGDALPALAGVVGAKHAQSRRRGVVTRLIGPHRGIQAPRRARRDRNVDLRQVRRQARAEARPGRPAVGRLEQAARGALELVLVLPGAETRLPQRRIHDLRLQRIDGDRGTAGVLIAVQNPLPADSGVR